MVAPTMRPQLKAGVFFAPVPEGVYLRGNGSRLLLKGKSLYPLLERLLPHLDGQTTLEALTRGLDAGKQRMIIHLLEKLAAHQFVRDASLDESPTPQAEEAERSPANQAFIAAFQTSALSRLAEFHQQRLLLLSCTSGLAALVQTSLHSGTREISVLVTPEDEHGASFNLEEVTGAEDAPEQTVRLLPISCWDDEDELRAAIQACDAVVHLSTRPLLARARLLNRLCLEEQKRLVQALLVGNEAWLGPLVDARDEEQKGCWECAWRRLQANLVGFSACPADSIWQDQPRTPASAFLSGAELTMLAQWLIFALFKHVTRTGLPGNERQMSVLHLESGLSESHAFLPHPSCQACQPPVAPTAQRFLAQTMQLQNQAPLGVDEFMERLTGGVVDARLGLFRVFAAEALEQMPLAIYQATLSHPTLRAHAPETLTVAEMTAEEASLRAAQTACAFYAASLVDCRLLPDPQTARQVCAPVLSAEQIIEGTGQMTRRELWSWALDMQTRQAWLVPAEYVFSALRQPAEADDFARERGLAAGMSWSEAICQALLDWCRYLTVEQVNKARQPYAQVDLSAGLLTPDGACLYELLKIATGEEPVIYDITGPLGVPTFAICCGEKVAAYSAHWEQARALTLGFVQALQPFQAPSALRPANAPELPVALRGTRSSTPRYTLPEDWPDRQAWALQRLQAHGLRALAVPLNHDPALVRVLPFIVRVLLAHTQAQREE